MFITLVITYLSIVFSELVPKRLALQNAERTSLLVAPVLDRVAFAFRPLIWLLSTSTNAVVRLFGGDPNASASRSRKRSCATSSPATSSSAARSDS